MWHVLEKREITEGFLLGKPDGMKKFASLSIHGNILLKLILRKLDRRM